VVLPNNGQGLCNAVYIDDVINAIFCAARTQSPKIGPYLVSADAPVTWAEYYRAYARWIVGSAITGEPLRVIEKRIAKEKLVSGIAPALLPGSTRLKISRTLQHFPGLWQAYNTARGRRRPAMPALPSGANPVIQPDTRQRVYPGLETARFMSLRSAVSIKRANAELGYKPEFDLAKAMEIVGPWLQWAGLAPSIRDNGEATR
jgi:nucleoside-diphosphate-sugar epimerase